MVLSRRRRFAANGAGLAAEGPLGIPVGVLIGFVALVACIIATGYYATSRANQEAAEAKSKLAEMEKRWAERGGLSQSQGGQAEPPPEGLGTMQAGGMSQMKMDAASEAAAVAAADGLATCAADLRRANQQLRIARGWVREGLEHCVKLRKKYSKARHKWQARKGKGGAGGAGGAGAGGAGGAGAGAADGDSGYGDGIDEGKHGKDHDGHSDDHGDDHSDEHGDNPKRKSSMHDEDDDEKDEKDDEDKEDKDDEDEHGKDKHGDGEKMLDKDGKDDEEDDKDDDADHEKGVKAGMGV
ncbi:unnamed protein product [Closterium sp. NIES-65]|nr:unnamed protein product [Closterium sp. NIES-65]